MLSRRLLPVRRLPVVARDRDRARLRRLPRLRRLDVDRHALRVHRLPRELLRSRAAALAALQHVPRRGRRARQDHRRPRRGAGDPGQARRNRPRADRGPRRVREHPLRLRPAGRRCSTGSSLDVPAGHDGRAGRPHRRGQVDDREAPRPLLRPARGRDHDRRHRPARRHPGKPAPPARHRPAGGLPLRRHRAREHPLRPARRDARGGRGRGRARSAPTSSSSRSRTATRRRSPSAERGSRSASASSSPSPARCSPTRGSSILDEATSSVDIGTERRIEEALATLLAGRTAFVIAHRLSTIRSADLIVVLEHGVVVEQGTHEQLLAREGRYLALYGDWATEAA